jgi:hypothetical protein
MPSRLPVDAPSPQLQHKSPLNMTQAALALSFLAAAVLYAAAHEYFAENRRDARLLAGVGGSGVVASFGLLLA